MHSQKAPAARTTRVRGASKSSPSIQKDLGGGEESEQYLPIIGEVRERAPKGKQDVLRNRQDFALMNNASGFPRACHRSKSKFKFGRQEKSNNVPGRDDTGEEQDGDAIGNEADAILGGMDLEEIEAARKEILTRLPKQTVSFLKSRSQKRSEKQQTMSTEAKSVVQQKDACSPLKKTLESSRSPHEMPLPILQRLRFDIEGNIAEIAPIDMTEDTVHHETLQRDLVRQAEGSVETSHCYSLLECKVLARSTDSNQRSIGLRFIGNILSMCKNHIWQDGPGCKVALEEYVGRDIAPLSPHITWLNIWQHAVYSVQVAKIIRYALDDTNLKVLMEACNALVALLGIPELGKKLLKDADMNPSIGIPKCQVCHMQRSDAKAWVPMPLNILDEKELQGKGGETDELDLARIDPISGLLNMRVLSRICFLIQNEGIDVTKKMKRHLLDVLFSFAAAGKHVVKKMVQTSNLVGALISFLPPFMRSSMMDTLAVAALEILCILVDYTEEWEDARALQHITKFSTNALLCWSGREGKWESLEVIMKLWRSLKISGKIFSSFDDIYDRICYFMFPEMIVHAERIVLIGGREAFLIAAACTSAGHISSSCCLSVLQDIRRWFEDVLCSVSSSCIFFNLDDQFLSKVAAILHFLQCVCQNGSIWESSEDAEDGQNIIRSIIQRIFRVIISPNKVSSDFFNQGTSGSCRMAIISSYMNLVYLSGLDIFSGTNAVQDLFECIEISEAPMVDPDILQPWDMRSQQHILQLSRLVDSIEMNIRASQPNVKQFGLTTHLNLQLLSLLPPGSEKIGLRLLSHMFGNPAKYFIQQGINKMIENAPDYINITSSVSYLQEYDDNLRVKALAGSSSIMGYELKDASGWEHLKPLQDTQHNQYTILNGEDSFLPLSRGWIFADVANAPHLVLSLGCYHGILAWIFGMESEGILKDQSPATKHFLLIKSLFVRNRKKGDLMFVSDPTIRLLGSLLLSLYMMDMSASESEYSWTLQEARHITEAFITDSYGDAFFGIAISTFFDNHIAPPETQEEVLSLLKDGMSLQYLPKLSNYLPGQANCLLKSIEDSRKNMNLYFLLDVISSDSFAKAIEAESLVVDVIMVNLLQALQKDPNRKNLLHIISRRLKNHSHIQGIENAMKYLT